jgi:hypothetical protein
MRLFSRVPASLLILATLISLSLVAIQPFMRSQMLLSDDAALHLYRTIVLDHSLRYDHPIYPRFSSALAYGYGAPLFNYFSPAAYYLPRTLHVFGMSFVDAWLAAMVLYLWLAALGAFLLGRILTNTAGGVVAAVAYVYSPYLLYDAVSRGTITEVAGLAMLPLVLYALTRLARRPSSYSLLLSVISYSIFIPLHNIVTLHGSILIAVYALLLSVTSAKPLRTLISLAWVGMLGVGLTAFFWLPALGETGWIKLPAITATLPDLDVTRHLRDLDAVLALPSPIDPSQQQASIPITVSWVAIVITVMGLITAVAIKQLRYQILFWTGVLVFTLFMNTPASALVWQQVPLLNYTQFAWRILGISSIALAILCALSLYTLELRTQKPRLSYAVLIVLVTGLILYSLPFTYRPTQSLEADDILSAQRHERLYGEVALSSYSEYLPVWVTDTIDPELLTSRWEQAPVISRWVDTEGLQIEQESWSGTSATFEVVLDQGRTVTLAWLYMPPWAVTVNGVTVSSYPNENGLLSFDLPTGRSFVTIEYTASHLQQAAIITSIGTFGLFVATFLGWKPSYCSFHSSVLAQPRVLLVTCLSLGIGLVVVKTAVIDQTDNLWHQRRWTQGTFDGAPIVGGVFNHELLLLSSNASVAQSSSTEVLVSTYWTALQPMSRDYGLLYSIRNQAGIEVMRGTNYRPAGLDTSRWLVGLYLQDTIRLTMPLGTLPGRYDVFVAAYDYDRLLPTINAVGNPDRPELRIGMVEIDPVGVPYQSQPFEGSITLLRVGEVPQQVMEGSVFILDLEWLAGVSPRENFQYQLQWQLGSGITVASEAQALAAEHPPALWRDGYLYRTPIQVIVPLFNQTGEYTLSLQLLDLRGQVAYKSRVGSLNVSTPDREFAQPSVDSMIDATWKNGIKLLGYRVKADQLFLVWQTTEFIRDDLRLFVHLLNAEGAIVDQHDEVPVNWTRPTTSWLPGEYITTTHTFSEEAWNASTITVGFYNPVTFARVEMTTGTTAFELPVATIDYSRMP